MKVMTGYKNKYNEGKEDSIVLKYKKNQLRIKIKFFNIIKYIFNIIIIILIFIYYLY